MKTGLENLHTTEAGENCRANVPAEPYFLFDHIQKTGGSAFKTVLEQIFGLDNISPAVSRRTEIWASERYAAYRVINGHFQAQVPMHIATARRRITILRDPIDRLVSEYYFFRNDVERADWNKFSILAKDYDLLAYIEVLQAHRDAAISNLYTRHFASQLTRKPLCPSEYLAVAKESLDHYDFVGVQEHFVDTVDLFCIQFGLPGVPVVPSVNVTSKRKSLKEIDIRSRARLVELNQLDMELYHFALEKFQAKKRRIFSRSMVQGPLKSSMEDIDAHARARAATENAPESFGDLGVEICGAKVVGADSQSALLRSGEEATISLELLAHVNVPALTVGIEISDELGEIVFGTNTHVMNVSQPVAAGHRYTVRFTFAANMRHGRYNLGSAIHTGASHLDRCFHWRDRLTTFDVADAFASGFVGYCRLTPKVTWREKDE